MKFLPLILLTIILSCGKQKATVQKPNQESLINNGNSQTNNLNLKGFWISPCISDTEGGSEEIFIRTSYEFVDDTSGELKFSYYEDQNCKKLTNNTISKFNYTIGSALNDGTDVYKIDLTLTNFRMTVYTDEIASQINNNKNCNTQINANIEFDPTACSEFKSFVVGVTIFDIVRKSDTLLHFGDESSDKNSDSTRPSILDRTNYNNETKLNSF